MQAIPSKSAAHRILIAAALSGLDLAPYCDGLSRDITATKACLQVLQAGQRKREETISESHSASHGAGSGPAESVPDPAGDAADDRAQLACGESGSTLRFLIPLAGVLGIDADFLCEGRLPDRPMEPFLSALAEHGCSVTGHNPKQLQGRLTGGDFCLPGNISSQYVTGLLMALPLASEDSRIIVEGTLQSRPYIDLTLEVLAKAGIQVSEHTEHGAVKGNAGIPERTKGASAGITNNITTETTTCTVFEVPGRQKYQLPQKALEHIEGDWSNAAFWLVMDAMLQEMNAGAGYMQAGAAPAEGSAGKSSAVIHVAGLDPDSRQGDKAIVSVIDRICSADVMLYQQGRNSSGTAAYGQPAADAAQRLDISVPGRSGFVEIDAADIPDLVPIIAAFACGRPAGALTHITGAARLRLKESDRLQAVTETLTALGADITEEPAGLMIRGTGTLTGGEVRSWGDHRIVMMAAAAACIAKEDIIIRGAEAVAKSYPRFFEDYRQIGGSWEEIGGRQTEC